MRFRTFVHGTALCIVLNTFCSTASGSFRVCNNTRALVNLAVGVNDGNDFATEGWWVVTPGSCATPIHGPLKGRFIYLYATSVDSGELLEGSVSMCVDRVKFKAVSTADCWRRGLMSAAFSEIDTGVAADWTTFLKDPSK